MLLRITVAILCFAIMPAHADGETKNHKPLDPGWVKSATEAIPQVIETYGGLIKQASKEANIPFPAVVAVMTVESLGLNNDHKGPVRGVMQTKAKVAQELGIRCDMGKPECSIRVGVEYLARLYEHYELSFGPKLFLAYNQGPTGAERFALKHDPKEHLYVRMVIWVINNLPEDFGLSSS